MKQVKSMIAIVVAIATTMTTRAQDITVGTVAELQAVATTLQEGTDDYTGKTIVLMVDLDLTDIEWVPIGTTSTPFNGTFDGGGHWVNNLTVDIDGTATGNVAGLFGCVGQSGTVRRVGVASGSIHISAKTHSDANCYVGGIAGLNMGRIEQCANRATVVGNWTMAHVGGIAGANGIVGGGTTEAAITNCYNQGRIFTTATTYYDMNYLGGIVGDNDGTVCRVYSYATVSEAANGGDLVGYNAGRLTAAYADGDAMRGFALDGLLNTQGDYTIWTFAEAELPTLGWKQTYLRGDVNQDGKVNTDDVAALVAMLLGQATFTPTADVNQDGTQSVADVTELINIILNK